MLQVEDIFKENLEDMFKICSWNRSFAPMDGPIQEKARELKRRWILDMLEQQGPCSKIAYLDRKPVAQILFYPEEAMPYIHNPRKDVIYLKCIFNCSPGARRKGVGNALMKSLIEESQQGLDCLGGRPSQFIVTRPFPHEGDLPLADFYEKYGFKQGHQEMFLEIKGKYVAREIPEYRPLPGDLDRTIIFYDPTCEWGYFYAFKVEELIQGMDPDHPVEIYNILERTEGYMKTSLQRMTAGRTIVKGQIISSGIFWTDREAFHGEVKEALRK